MCTELISDGADDLFKTKVDVVLIGEIAIVTAASYGLARVSCTN